MTAEMHGGKSCRPAGPDAMHSDTVQKKLRFPLDSRASAIKFAIASPFRRAQPNDKR
jgi:hypothetical protein